VDTLAAPDMRLDEGRQGLISIRLDEAPEGLARDRGEATGSGSMIAGTKLGAATASSRSTFRLRRQVRSCARDTPCRRAVADTKRGPARLSSTIRTFSSSDHRRRRPVSTISRRPKALFV
jgi:hypothetical protein